MGKRISRKELKEKIKTLERKNLSLKFDAEEANKEKEELAKRLDYLGNEEWEQLDINRVEVKPIPWGGYVRFAENDRLKDVPMEEIKRHLISKLASGLMESNYVQIIVHDNDLFPGEMTIGAKLYVVPWEKTVIGRMAK